MKHIKKLKNLTPNQYIKLYGIINYNIEYGYFDSRINKWIMPPHKDISKQIEKELLQIKK